RWLEFRAHGQKYCQYGDHGIARPGHVAHADGIGRNVKSALAALTKAHAILTARYHYGGTSREVTQFRCGHLDLFIGARGAPDYLGELLAIRRNKRRPLVNAVVLALRIDNNWQIRDARRIDQ